AGGRRLGVAAVGRRDRTGGAVLIISRGRARARVARGQRPGAALRGRPDEGAASAGGRARVAGGDAVAGGAVDGRGVAAKLVVALNLMWRRDAVETGVLRRPLVGPMLFFADEGETWLLYMISGQGRFDAASGLPPLAQGDAAVLAAPSRRRFLLDGGGELLAMRLKLRTPR